VEKTSAYRSSKLIFLLVLASIGIVSYQNQTAYAGACGSTEGDCDQDGFTPSEGDCDDYNANIYPGHGSCSVPIKEINEVIIDVQELANEGEITSAQSNALLVKLESAIKKIESDKISGAIGSLNAFINQIKAFIPKVIDPEIGNQLILDVQNIIMILKTG